MIKEELKEQMVKHNSFLSEYACKDEDAIYLEERDEDLRTNFFRDIDRILYSLAFIRYQDKTQVFPKTENDHVSKRMIHVQLVSKIARTMGRALGLNEDLIEAAALGHDLGHTPFGHQGEQILNEISLEHNEGYFNHNIESVRLLMNIENYGKGLNLSIQVLDAIMCHNGEFLLGLYEPKEKTVEDFFLEYERSYHDKDVLVHLKPMTLEGCIVRISDLIGYLGRDIDDAIRLGIIKRKDIPKDIANVLGVTTKDIVNTCIMDIINNSYKKKYIRLSDDVFKAILNLKKFNYQYIYSKAMSDDEAKDLKNKFKILFETYLEDIKTNNKKSPIVKSYLDKMIGEYKENNTNERIVLDYMAGMTDDYLLREYARIMGE